MPGDRDEKYGKAMAAEIFSRRSKGLDYRRVEAHLSEAELAGLLARAHSDGVLMGINNAREASGFDAMKEACERMDKLYIAEENGDPRVCSPHGCNLHAGMEQVRKALDSLPSRKLLPKRSSAAKRRIVWVDESCLVKGHGFRVMVVTEGEPGFHWTGDWPYQPGKGRTLPWFWGPTIQDARRMAAQHNALLGVDEETAALIVGRSMALQNKEASSG